jgi:two-component system cell cycle response regulator
MKRTVPEPTPMSDTLFGENMRLRAQLKELLDQARINQQIMRRHQTLDLRLIGAVSFVELFDVLFRIFPDSSDLDVVTLSLLDPDYGIRRILVELGVDFQQFPNLRFLQEESEIGDLSEADTPVAAGAPVTPTRPALGPYSEHLHGAMFPEPIAAPASVAIVPLTRNNQPIGWLNLGSFDRTRFARHMATDFIEHRASVVALCIENVINRERLKHLGLTDSLTQVNNRRYIERRLIEEIGRSRRAGNPLSCMYIDIDHFKQINDEIGHQAGDEVLRNVAARIKAELRLSDALGRFGGEEFIVLLGDADETDAAAVAERIRAGIAEQPLQLNSGGSVTATVSIGIATLEKEISGEPPETAAREFVARADRALYRAKAEGRNRVVIAPAGAANPA